MIFVFKCDKNFNESAYSLLVVLFCITFPPSATRIIDIYVSIQFIAARVLQIVYRRTSSVISWMGEMDWKPLLGRKLEHREY